MSVADNLAAAGTAFSVSIPQCYRFYQYLFCLVIVVALTIIHPEEKHSYCDVNDTARYSPSLIHVLLYFFSFSRVCIFTCCIQLPFFSIYFQVDFFFASHVISFIFKQKLILFWPCCEARAAPADDNNFKLLMKKGQKS